MDKKKILILAQSAGFNGGNYAKITINNTLILTKNNENDHSRGLHIVIMNPQTGKIESAQVFDTY